MAEEQMHPTQVGDSDPETRLPEDPAIAELADHGREDFLAVVRDHPASSLCWALLAEGALLIGAEDADIAGYAYAVTGCHRGMGALRRTGWHGVDEAGTIPWEHLSNQGFLRCVWARSVAAGRIGQEDEARHWEEFLRRVSESGWRVLHTTLSLPDIADSDAIGDALRDDEGQTTVAEAVGSTFQG